MATESGQIQGGVGYTWEYDAHLYFRRALARRRCSATNRATGTASRGTSPASSKREPPACVEPTPKKPPFAPKCVNGSRRTPSPALKARRPRSITHPRRSFATGKRRSDGSARSSRVAGPPSPVRRIRRSGGTPIEQMIWNEEQSAFDVPAGFIRLLGMIGPALMRFGTDEQKAYLPAMLRGDEVWCQLFSEPEPAPTSRPFGPGARSTATSSMITGQKVWTTSANFAEKGFIVLRTNWRFRARRHQLRVDRHAQPGSRCARWSRCAGIVTSTRSSSRTCGPARSRRQRDRSRLPVTTFVLMNEGAFIGTSSPADTSAESLVRYAVDGRLEDPIAREQLGRPMRGIGSWGSSRTGCGRPFWMVGCPTSTGRCSRSCPPSGGMSAPSSRTG